MASQVAGQHGDTALPSVHIDDASGAVDGGQPQSAPPVFLAPDKHAVELDMEKGFWSACVRSRFIRLTQIVLVPMMFLLVLDHLTSDGETDTHWLSRLMGICLALQYTGYFVNLARTLYPTIDSGNDSYVFKVLTRLSNGMVSSDCVGGNVAIYSIPLTHG